MDTSIRPQAGNHFRGDGIRNMDGVPDLQLVLKVVSNRVTITNGRRHGPENRNMSMLRLAREASSCLQGASQMRSDP